MTFGGFLGGREVTVDTDTTTALYGVVWLVMVGDGWCLWSGRSVGVRCELWTVKVRGLSSG